MFENISAFGLGKKDSAVSIVIFSKGKKTIPKQITRSLFLVEPLGQAIGITMKVSSRLVSARQASTHSSRDPNRGQAASARQQLLKEGRPVSPKA